MQRLPNSNESVAILENIAATKAQLRNGLYTEQRQKCLLPAETISRGGISCSHWIFWLMCGELLSMWTCMYRIKLV